MSTAASLPGEVDVLVVGGGASGLAAALAAAGPGCSVALAEKNAQLGGTMARSVGTIAAAGTRHQRRKGIDDSAAAHGEDLALFAGPLAARDNAQLRALLAEHGAETVRMLEALGVVFFGPMPESPHRVPRLHNVLPNSGALVYHMRREAERRRVAIRCGQAARRLVHEGGRIAGVEFESATGVASVVRARRGVVLACGDYSSAADLKAQYLPDALAAVEGINPSSNGEGHRLVVEAGGELLNADLVKGPQMRFVAPETKKWVERIPPARVLARAMHFALEHLPASMLRPFMMMFATTNLAPSGKLLGEGALLVNRDGEAIAAGEDGIELAIAAQPGKLAYFIFDDAVARKFSRWPNYVSTAPGVGFAYLADYARNRRDIYASAASIEALARKIGVPPVSLASALAARNAPGAGKRALAAAPFHALGPVKSWIVLTDGGARISGRFEVLDRSGVAIPGLYAAGSTGQGGVVLEGHGHHLGWAITSGRLAGMSAAGKR
jgi:succinate dehydrogenase/fumarate reductase flavoprotein subunit